MKLKTVVSGLVALALVVTSALQAVAQTPSVLTAYYDAATGNIKLQNTTSGTLGVQSFDIITLGNGSVGALSGRPGNIGWLSGSTANISGFSFITSNTSVFGYNGLYSQASGITIGGAGFTLSPYPGWSTSNPIGPAGTYWDLGNIAVTGMTQSDINTRFLTDPELTPPNFDSTVFGQYLVSSNTNGGSFSVTTPMNIVAVQAVPEPSTYAMAFAGLAFGGFKMWRRRRTA